MKDINDIDNTNLSCNAQMTCRPLKRMTRRIGEKVCFGLRTTMTIYKYTYKRGLIRMITVFNANLPAKNDF
jgi:hypothetical protein